MKLTSVKLSALSLMALAMTACTSNEEVAMPQPESNQIGFSIVTNNLTRASNSYCSTNLPGVFKVTAYNNGKNYYGDVFDEMQKNTWGDGNVVWVGTTDRYWPRVDDDSWSGLTFFAFVDDFNDYSDESESISKIVSLSETNTSSSSATSNEDVTPPTFTNFTVKPDVSKQIDLMYATTANRKNTGAVPLNFRHALSQVCFKARNLDPRIKSLVINKIEIHGLTSRGNYQFPTASTNVTATTTHNATEVPTGAGGKGSWTLSEESDYTNQTFSIENLDIPVTCPSKINGSYNEPAPVNINVPEMTTENKHEDVTHEANPYKNALNLIPQVVSPMVTEGDGGAYFKINVTMKVSEKSDVSESTEEELESLEAQTKDIIIPVDIAWEEGNRYIYTFIWEDNGHVTYQARFADFDYVEEQQSYVPQTFHQAVKMRNAVGDPNDDENYLPALYFATCNIGANSPDEYGLYFWWGDVVGHKGSDFAFGNKKTDESDKTVYNDAVLTVGKDVKELYANGFVTSDKANSDALPGGAVLKDTYDAAKCKWGGNWRMPTVDEWYWLFESEEGTNTKDKNCLWKWWDAKDDSDAITFNYKESVKTCERYKIPGMFVMSKETGGIIFIPAAGQYSKINTNYSFKTQCSYWSSSIYGGSGNLNDYESSYKLYIIGPNNYVVEPGGTSRGDGLTIRPVCESID